MYVLSVERNEILFENNLQPLPKGIENKVGKDQTSIKTSHSVCPMVINMDSLNPRLNLELKVESLQILLKLIKHTKKSRVFAFWYVFLPNCVFNPCKKGILELINHTDQQTRERALDLLMEIFQSSATHLQLANAHCRAGSFTPVCLEFASALGRYEMIFLNPQITPFGNLLLSLGWFVVLSVVLTWPYVKVNPVTFHTHQERWSSSSNIYLFIDWSMDLYLKFSSDCFSPLQLVPALIPSFS